jgi:transposase
MPGSAGVEPHAWETGLMNAITYVGLDVHKATISVALAKSGRRGEVRQLRVFASRPEVLIDKEERLRASSLVPYLGSAANFQSR